MSHKINLISADCKQTLAGLEYDERLSVSAAGTACERWDELPAGVEMVNDAMFPQDGSVSAASNYCRNPTNDLTGPFCYDSQGQKRYCNIKFCSLGESRKAIVGVGEVTKINENKCHSFTKSI